MQQRQDVRVPAIPAAEQICLFLDFDGTLVEFTDDPRAARPDAQLLRILAGVQTALGGALAVVSGRRLEDLDALLQPLQLAAAGLHGLERRDAQGRRWPATPPIAAAALHDLRLRLLELVERYPGLLLEDKGATLALHYRRVPQLQATVRSAVAAMIAGSAPELELLEGDRVLEVKPHVQDKATAVESFMREAPFAGRKPVFVGDDLTDRDGFEAVRRHDGVTVAVGDRVTAQWRLADPAAVRTWLAQIAARAEPRA
ncbi:MAG: trehalose-phosphatase [Gammaproteobacteria bacterium]|nr:trehalose-phosphatase [Gammaproteobacteria bacterium]